MKRLLVAVLLWHAALAAVVAQDDRDLLSLNLSAELTLAPSIIDGSLWPHETLNAVLLANYEYVSLIGDFSLRNDQKYSSEEDFMFGRYFTINNGGLILDFDTLALQAGRFVHTDLLDTPYSLFVSSIPLPALLVEASLRLGPFLYESRWIRLTRNSREGWPDRGANYKVFAFQAGDFRFGLQDSAVYFDRVFDEEYFLSPVPHIITQIVTKGRGKPWSEAANDNSIMGLFVEWQRPGSYAYAQWLVDDISLDFLVPGFLRDKLGDKQIPQKWAWSLGGRHAFAFGTLGFYHGGATKYTFQPSRLDQQYGYTYFPDTEYTLSDGSTMTLHYLDNYVGYKYGENNIAFLADYGRRFGPVDFGAALEYVVSGSKSIANPWHEFDYVYDAGRQTRLLDDPVLEHTLAVTAKASWPLRRWTVYSSLTLGGVFNELKPVPGEDGDGDIFRPQPGEHRFLYRWTTGAQFRLSLPAARRSSR